MIFRNSRYYSIIPKNEKVIMEHGDNEKSVLWSPLDVSILHNLIISHILGMGNYTDKDISYTRDAEEAVSKAGKSGIAFIMNPPHIKTIRQIADFNERLPKKTTYFFPKPLSGLVMYKF